MYYLNFNRSAATNAKLVEQVNDSSYVYVCRGGQEIPRVMTFNILLISKTG